MIPDEAVEAAWERTRDNSDGYPYPEREEIRRILEAAAPFIAAQALENAADAVDEDLYDDHDPFYVGWLKARAENIRENGTDETECDDCVTHRTTPTDDELRVVPSPTHPHFSVINDSEGMNILSTLNGTPVMRTEQAERIVAEGADAVTGFPRAAYLKLRMG